ncbi:hypothetical protein LZ554_007058 [Drepanopeziza brunnea f. sp. 'monogermtubi']|nr:hypothetical protein LZ554_007058 [Drepanopeziza brunnea f. sp. 'monogermtubi']
MRIACLQFSPQVGDIDNNLNRADSVLSRANPQDLDLLVLPELAFTGYNFHSLQHISPYLEPTTSGITSLWARTTALKYNCIVTAGYPEKVDLSPKWPASPEYYNSAITVNADGETIANYRKSFLFYTDETWALEGCDGFFYGDIDGLGVVAMGICMDLNPYKFQAAWTDWEFAHHVLHREANLIILSMAWMTREEGRSFSRTPKEPDMETLSYWLSRLEPIIRNEGEEEIIAVFANRTGIEGDVVYAGTSAVLGIQDGEVSVYGILGRGENQLLVVDTSQEPRLQLVSERASISPDLAPTVGSGIPSTATVDAVYVSAFHQNMDGRFSTPSSELEQNLASQLSVSTGKKSVAPPKLNKLSTASLDGPQLDPWSFSPVSPGENSVLPAYLWEKTAAELPGEEEATHIPARSEPRRYEERFTKPQPLPSVHSRPCSTKSRNCSRSRGPTLQESSLLNRPMSRMGIIMGDEVRYQQQQSPFFDSMSMVGQGIDVDLLLDDKPDEMICIDDENSKPSHSPGGNTIGDVQKYQAGFMDKHINKQQTRASCRSPRSTSQATPNDISSTLPVKVHRSRSRGRASATIEEATQTSLSTKCVGILTSTTSQSHGHTTLPSEASTLDWPDASTEDMELWPPKSDPAPFESSFTRNPLGPRSRHVSPRPLSTVW